MMMKKRIPAREGRGEYEEKKSRFYSFCHYVTSEEEAKEYIAALHARYHDASHCVYGYQLGEDRQIQRSSDDGEPAGTAGRPVLESINGSELTDVVVVVIRYFGGTLLGAGGLVRAYTKSAQLALADSGRALLVRAVRICLLADYAWLGKVQNYLAQEDCTVERIDYQQNAAIYCLIDSDRAAVFCERLTSIFPQGLHVTTLPDPCWRNKSDDK